MSSYYVEFLEPDKDLNVALDRLSATVGTLYRDCWNNTKRDTYGQAFNMNIQAFTSMWFNKALKIFVAYDAVTRVPVGFLAGIVFRPIPYEANVFQIEEYYALGGIESKVEPLLIDHAAQAMKYLGTDEVWVSRDSKGGAPNLPHGWKLSNEFTLYRYVKE